MMFKIVLLLAGLLPLLKLGAFAAVHEELPALPAGWTHVATPADSSTIVLQIGLQQQNLDQLESKLIAVSTPNSADYGNHLEREDVDALLAPLSESNSAVLAWLKQAGVSNVQSDGEWVNFATSVGTANQLLNSQFKYYENNGVQKLRTMSYSIPDSLAAHIDLISPTTYFGKTTAQVLVPKQLLNKAPLTPRMVPRQLSTNCSALITPQCIKQLYNINNYTAKANSGSKIAFGSFLNQSARFQDLSAFEAEFGIPQQSFSVQLINGGVNDQSISSNHGEADLDVEYIVGVSHPLPITSFITGGSPPFIPNLDEPLPSDNSNEPYLNYYQYLLSQPNSKLPQVISNSYGDDEQTVPEKYARRVCNMIGQLGLRGISVLESSGDTGVGAPCQSNDGKMTPQFTPQFPGTCPYITAVGGTQAYAPEVAWVDGSGGFSNYFAQPAYQKTAVETYLNNYITPSTKEYFSAFTNFKGRGFPDVSAHSLHPDFSVIVNNKTGLSGGTSAACPVFSATVALLNDARLRAGKPALGFLNPLIYSIGYLGLTDITGGGSVGCNGVNGQTGQPIPGASVIPFASWNATIGWDPVTGLGVPDFQKLLALALA